MKKPILPLLLLVSLTSVSASPALAQYEQTLRNQQQQVEDLNQQLRIQANQRQIERLQQQVANGYDQPQNQSPPVVVVEQKQPSGLGVVIGTVLGAALSNGYVNCGPGGNCGYGYGGGGGYRGGYYGNPGRCAVRTGYRGCSWKLPVTTAEPDVKSVERQLNSVRRPEEPTNDLERYLGNVNLNCANAYTGCAAGYTGIRW